MTLDKMKILQQRLREGLDSLKLDEHPTETFLRKTTDARCALAFAIGFLGSAIEEAEKERP